MSQCHLWHLAVLLGAAATYLGSWKLGDSNLLGATVPTHGLVLFIGAISLLANVVAFLTICCLCIHDRSWRAVEPHATMTATAISWGLGGVCALIITLVTAVIEYLGAAPWILGFLAISIASVVVFIIGYEISKFFSWLFENY
jgi:hypothetical protein